MIDSLHQFQGRIEQLIAFLDDAESINALMGTHVPENKKFDELASIRSHLTRLRSSKIDRKVQTYVTAIILLYGLFEQYVEEILMAYLEELDSTISTFEDLPEKIRKSHTSLSAQLLMNSQLDKYRDRCNEVDIIQRMHSCTTGGPFHLNSLAFIDHKSNFRIDALNLFFDAAGIPGISTSIKQEPAFEEYKAKRFSDQGIDRLPDKVVFEDLDELAWRRNVVAHGWPDSTLSIELMKERAAFIQALGECIYEVLRQSLLPHVVKHLGRALASPLAVYDHSVVCFRLETGTISTGSRIIARAPTGRHFEGRVISLELEHISQEKVAAPPPVDVGCRVGFKAKMNQDYFLIEEQ